jgi:exopolyphosphatase/pppGpp-phosphohydrolase
MAKITSIIDIGANSLRLVVLKKLAVLVFIKSTKQNQK